VICRGLVHYCWFCLVNVKDNICATYPKDSFPEQMEKEGRLANADSLGKWPLSTHVRERLRICVKDIDLAHIASTRNSA